MRNVLVLTLFIGSVLGNVFPVKAFIGGVFWTPGKEFEQTYTSGVGVTFGLRRPLFWKLSGELSAGYTYFLPDETAPINDNTLLHTVPLFASLRLAVVGKEKLQLGVYGSGGVAAYLIAKRNPNEVEHSFQFNKVGGYRWGAFLKIYFMTIDMGTHAFIDQNYNQNNFWEVRVTFF